MTAARARSLKALTLLRKSQLDRQAGQLVGLRGLESQISAARSDSLQRAAAAAGIDDLAVLPYMRNYLSHIGHELTRLDGETATIQSEIIAQQAQVTAAWRALRVVENVEAARQKLAQAEAQKADEKQQDELALIAHAAKIR